MKGIVSVLHLVYEWNIVIYSEFNELKLVFHEAQPSGIKLELAKYYKDYEMTAFISERSRNSK